MNELEKMKQAVKDIEERIINSGAARRLPTTSQNVHRISANNYNSYNNSYPRQTSQSSGGSGGGWIVVVIIIIIVLIFMFAH